MLYVESQQFLVLTRKIKIKIIVKIKIVVFLTLGQK